MMQNCQRAVRARCKSVNTIQPHIERGRVAYYVGIFVVSFIITTVDIRAHQEINEKAGLASTLTRACQQKSHVPNDLGLSATSG